jgi:hypothetical protein
MSIAEAVDGNVVPSRSRVPNVHPATVPAVRLPALPPVRPSVRPPAGRTGHMARYTERVVISATAPPLNYAIRS